jgi:hypothetical protein
LVAPGIESGTSGSVARNSDYWTTEAVVKYINRRRKIKTEINTMSGRRI